MEFSFNVQLHCLRASLKKLCEATKSGQRLLIYKCPTLSFLFPPLSLFVTSYHCHSSASEFTLGAVAVMCHRDVTLHTLADKNASLDSSAWNQ